MMLDTQGKHLFPDTQHVHSECLIQRRALNIEPCYMGKLQVTWFLQPFMPRLDGGAFKQKVGCGPGGASPAEEV